jgi:hypothetical protein
LYRLFAHIANIQNIKAKKGKTKNKRKKRRRRDGKNVKRKQEIHAAQFQYGIRSANFVKLYFSKTELSYVTNA